MLRHIVTGLAVGLVALLLIPIAAQGAPPERSINGLQAGLDENCFATVTWEPLQGGKPAFAHVVFKYLDASGSFRTVLQPGADEFHKVKQNAGLLEVDFASLAGTQPALEYRVEVNIVDGKDQPMTGLATAISSCNSAD